MSHHNFIDRTGHKYGHLTVTSRGANKRGKHGMTNHYLYEAWHGIKQRCLNPANKDYANYGRRGISVYEPWRTSFEAFRDYVLANLGERPLGHSLDRIDNDGHYEPGNIRWADRKTQRLNQRTKSHLRKAA
jgi:hypothetical protein